MKKITIIAMSAAALLAGISCNKEIEVETIQPVDQNTEQTVSEKVPMKFTAGMVTKASITDVEDKPISVNWDETDKIAVWDGTEWCEFSATSVDDNTAVFEGEITPKAGFEMTDFKAVYPYSAITDTGNEAISISVPATQTIPAGKAVDTSALVAVAPSNAEGQLSFSQVCALVKINVGFPKTTVTLEGTGLAGTVVCNPDGSIASSTSRTDAITLAHATGTLPKADYYVAVLPTTTVLTVTYNYGEAGYYTGTRTTASAIALEKGVAKAYIKETAISAVYNISTPAQLVDCASTWVEGYNYTVNLLADLDMAGFELAGNRNLQGTFNGNNHKIYNLVVETDTDACFIRNLLGEVNNLTLGSSDGVNYDGTSSIIMYNTSSSTAWAYAAPIIRLKTGANVENVVNFIPVSVKSGTKVKVRAAGLVGTVNTGPVTIKNCTNYGDVSNNSNTATANCNLSGILGPMDAAGTLLNVTNRGNLTCANNKYISQIGGICCAVYGGSTFTNCDNYGNITYGNLALNANTYIGGIAANGASNYTTKSTFSGCDNHGDITVGTTSNTTLMAGGICGWIRNVELNNCDNSGNLTTQHGLQTRLGGIVGSIHASSIVTGCDNTGNIFHSQTVANTGWQGVGGVVGFSENSPKPSITYCSNSGSVSASVNTTGYVKISDALTVYRVSIGGILGMAYTAATISNNINRGSVAAQNTHASTPYCQLGGIMGSDSDNSGACTISGNVNYGAVTQITANASYAFGGGLFGKLNFTTSVTGCKNYGTIVGTNVGAVAGSNAKAAIAVTLCDAVTVNSVTKAAAADVDAWLCPANSGTITPTYVAHDAGE